MRRTRLVGPVAGAIALIGYLCFRRYWLPDVVTAESIAIAEAQHAGGRHAVAVP